MQPLSSPDNRLFLGRGGSGKSTLALHQLREFKRIIIFDPNGEDAHKVGAVPIETKSDLVRMAGASGPMRICWRGFGEDRIDGFEWANRVIWAAGDFVAVWDEADRFMLPGGRMPSHGYNLVNMGRHRRCRVFACSRRPFRISRDFTALMTRAAVFRIIEPVDLKWLRDCIGSAATAELPRLADHAYVDWTEAGYQVASPLPVGPEKKLSS